MWFKVNTEIRKMEAKAVNPIKVGINKKIRQSSCLMVRNDQQSLSHGHSINIQNERWGMLLFLICLHLNTNKETNR